MPSENTIVRKTDMYKLKAYVKKYIEHELILSPDTIVVHECPNCHTRYPLNNVEPMFETKIVNFIMDMAERSDYMREATWQAIATRMAIERELEEN